MSKSDRARLKPVHEFVFDMDSKHTWRYWVEAPSFEEAVRIIVDGDNVIYDQIEQGGRVLPSTARLVKRIKP